MVKVTVIAELLDRLSMATLVNRINKMLMEEGDYETASKVSEGLLRHGAVRSTLPKDSELRRSLIAIYFNKQFELVNGSDLYSVVSKNELVDNISHSFHNNKEITLTTLNEFKVNNFGNIIKNYEYGNYSDLDLLQTVIILALIENKQLNFNDDRSAVLHHIITYIDDAKKIECNIPLGTPLSKVEYMGRIYAYRHIIRDMLIIN